MKPHLQLRMASLSRIAPQKSMTKLTGSIVLAALLTISTAGTAQSVNDSGVVSPPRPTNPAPVTPRSVIGSVSFTGSESTMSPRFFRSGTPGNACSTFSSGNFQYQEVQFLSDSSGSLTANFDPGTCGTGIFVTFHTQPFNPASICQNHVWTFASSQAFIETFAVSPNTPMTMVVSGVANAPGVVCGPATYQIDGGNQGPVDADLRLISLVSAPTQTNVNVPVTFTAISQNFGPGDAQDVVVSTTLSPDFRYTSHTAAGATCTTPQVGNSGTISCTWGGATAINATRTLAVTAFSNNNALNTVSAITSSTTPDPIANNNSQAVTVTVGLVIEGIPSLDRNAMLLLGLLLAFAGLIAIRRQN